MSTKKRGLGKGLSALISNELIDSHQERSKDSITSIDIKDIVPNKNQPRTEFEEKGLEELARSIKTHGLIQPILSRKTRDGYEIIAGERRWRAAKIAGLEKIPSIIKEIDEEESAKIALIENVQRENLNPIEEAKAYKKLMEDFDLTQEELSIEIGKSRSYISNTIRLLRLDGEVIDKISEGKLSPGHGKALLSIKDKERQSKIVEEILSDNLNVRDVEALVKDERIKRDQELEDRLEESYITSIEEDLMMALGTKVNLIQGDKRGKIEIEYYGDEDLERILETLIK